MKKKSRLSKKKLKGALLEIIRQSPGKKFNYKQLSKSLRIKKIGERLLVTEALYELRDEGLLNEASRGSYALVNKNKPSTGVVISSNRGGVIVKTEEGLEIDVDKKESMFALKGDQVEIINFIGKKKSKGFISRVLLRKKLSFVGKIQINNNVCFFIADDYRVYFDVFIRNTKLKSSIKNKQVHVKVTNWNCNNKNPEGEIIEVLGDINDLDVAINSILIDGGFANKFNSNVEKAAAGISKKINSSEIKSRLDLRRTPTFTIDPNDAKDFDDAISVLKLPNNNLEIGVHIADVGHYIKKDDIIDKEALKRGTSVYLVDRVIPMLPEVLSNDLCSLKPKVDRLCFSVIFEINNRAEILNYKISKSIIHSNKRFTYKEAQDNIDNASGEYHQELIDINNLAKIFRKKRKEEGSINFEREETKFLLDRDNNPIDVYTKESLDTNKLIEEYMLLANKAVAKHINEKMNNYSFIYRVHDIPDKEKISDLKNIIKKYKYSINDDNPKSLSKSLNELLDKIHDKPEKSLIETLVLRSMAKAKYATKNVGHYGLGFNYYSHFTSPIRRYPDLIVHRLINSFISKENYDISLDLDYISKHCSEMEKSAAIAERDSIKFMQIKFLNSKIGQEFSGVISGVTEWGLYVELDKNKCEGLVKINQISKNYLVFDKKTHSLTSTSKEIKYQLGQKVLVKILKADIEKKQVDFSLIA